jgi:hypothetical protein
MTKCYRAVPPASVCATTLNVRTLSSSKIQNGPFCSAKAMALAPLGRVGARPGPKLGALGPRDLQNRDRSSDPLPPARLEAVNAQSPPGGTLSARFRSERDDAPLRGPGGSDAGVNVRRDGSLRTPEPRAFAEPRADLTQVDLAQFELQTSPRSHGEDQDQDTLAGFRQEYSELFGDGATEPVVGYVPNEARSAPQDRELESAGPQQESVDVAEMDREVRRLEREAQQTLRHHEATNKGVYEIDGASVTTSKELEDLVRENQASKDESARLDAELAYARERAEEQTKERERLRQERESMPRPNSAASGSAATAGPESVSRSVSEPDTYEARVAADPPPISSVTRSRVAALQDRLVRLARRKRQLEAASHMEDPAEEEASVEPRIPDSQRTRQLLALTSTLQHMSVGQCAADGDEDRDDDLQHTHMHTRASLTAQMLAEALETEIVSQRVGVSPSRGRQRSTTTDQPMEDSQFYAHTQTGELYMRPSTASTHVFKVDAQRSNNTVDFIKKNRRAVTAQPTGPEATTPEKGPIRRRPRERRKPDRDFIKMNKDHVASLSATLHSAASIPVFDDGEGEWEDEDEDEEWEEEWEDDEGQWDDDGVIDESADTTNSFGDGASSVGQDDGAWIDDFE